MSQLALTLMNDVVEHSFHQSVLCSEAIRRDHADNCRLRFKRRATALGFRPPAKLRGVPIILALTTAAVSVLDKVVAPALRASIIVTTARSTSTRWAVRMKR
jgi:hypothetical protein